MEQNAQLQTAQHILACKVQNKSVKQALFLGLFFCYNKLMTINFLVDFFVPTSSRILDGYFAVGIFLLGLCIGSFLNCIIYRLEQKKSLSGRSFCPSCNHTLSWKDLFPVFSYLFLGGKCRYCKKKISFQYPLVEIFTGVVFLSIFLSQFQPDKMLDAIFMFYIISVLIIIFIYDLKHYLIPDKVLFPAIAVAGLYRILGFGELSFLSYLFGAIMASGFFFLIFFITRGKGMGFGDVKLAILMGLLLGAENVLVAIFLASFIGTIVGLTLMMLGKKGLKSEIPFAPFLITGTFLAIIFGTQIIQWYSHNFV